MSGRQTKKYSKKILPVLLTVALATGVFPAAAPALADAEAFAASEVSDVTVTTDAGGLRAAVDEVLVAAGYAKPANGYAKIERLEVKGELSGTGRVNGIEENSDWGFLSRLLSGLSELDLSGLSNTVIPGASSTGSATIRSDTLQKVVLGSKVKSIGDYAFWSDKALQKIDLGAVTSIGKGAFQGCASLSRLDLKKATEFGASAFSGCSLLEDVKFSSRPTFGAKCFAGCALLFTDGLPEGEYPGGGEGDPFADQTPFAYLSLSAGSPQEIVAGLGGEIAPPSFDIRTRDGGDYGELIASKGDYKAWLSPSAKTPTLLTDPLNVKFDEIPKKAGTTKIVYSLRDAPSHGESVTVTVRVLPQAAAGPDVKAQGITYGALLGESDIAGEVRDENGEAVEGVWTWDEPDIRPEAGVSYHAATFAAAGVHTLVAVEIAKAAPDVSVPSVSAIGASSSLGAARFGAFTQTGVLGEKLAGSWRFALPASTRFEAGEHDVAIEYDPKDPNYRKVSATAKLLVREDGYADAGEISVTLTEEGTLRAAVDAALILAGSTNPGRDYAGITRLKVAGSLSRSGSADDMTFSNDWTFIRRALTALETLDLTGMTNGAIPAFTPARSIKNASLGTVLLGPATTGIGEYAFCGNAALERIDLGGVVSVGDYAFKGCPELSDIGGFGSGLTRIGICAFADCVKLEEVDLAGSPSVALENSAFRGATALSTLDLGKVDDIPMAAFSGCVSLKKVDLSRVRSFGPSAFAGCVSFREIDLSAAQSFGSSAFARCANLESVAFPAHAAYAENAFAGCALVFTRGFPGGADLSLSPFGGQMPKVHFSLSPPEVFTELNEPIYAPMQNIKDCNGEDYANLFLSNADYSSWLSPKAKMPTVKVSPADYSFGSYAAASGDWTIRYSISGAPTDSPDADFTMHVRATDGEDQDALLASPTAGGITYGASLESLPVTGEVLSVSEGAIVSGTWSWETPSLRPGAGTVPCNAVFTPTDSERYSPLKKTVAVRVAKAYPAVSVPTLSAIEEGQELGEIVFGPFTQSGVPGDRLCGEWSFVYPEDVFFEGVHTGVPVEYDPKNSNYVKVSAKVTITVKVTTPVNPHHVVVKVSKAGMLKESVDAALRGIGFDPESSYGEMLSLTVTGPLSADAMVNLTSMKNDWTFIHVKLTKLVKLDLSEVTSDAIPGSAVVWADSYPHYPLASTKLREVVLGPAIKTIGRNVCYGNTGLRAINLENVTNVGEYAFYGCWALRDADLRSAETVQQCAFQDCLEVKTADLSKAKTIGMKVFYGCRGLEKAVIGETLGEIANSAFYNCSSLTEVVGLNSGGINRMRFLPYAFYGCSSLKTIDLSKSELSDVTPGTSAFEGCRSLETVVGMGTGAANAKITSLPEGFFANTGLKKIDLSYVLTLGTRAVTGCPFTEIDLSNVSSLGSGCFAYCTNLVSIVGLNKGRINTRLTAMPYGVFQGCTSLRSANFTYARSFGDYAFENCSRLEDVVFPASSTTTYGSGAFRYCALALTKGRPKGRYYSGAFASQIPRAYFSLRPGTPVEEYVKKNAAVDPPLVDVKDFNGDDYSDLFDPGKAYAYSSWLSAEAKKPLVASSHTAASFRALTATHGAKNVTYTLRNVPADVTRLDYTLHVWPGLVLRDGVEAQGITYGQTMEKSKIEGDVEDDAGASPGGSWVWDEPGVMPDAGTVTYGAKFVPREGGKYDPLPKRVSLTVRRATPDVSVPKAGSIVSGQTLADVRLGAFTQCGVAGDSLNGRWSFTSRTDEPLSEGVHDARIAYDPRDANYNGVAATVKVTVLPKEGGGAGNGDGSGIGDGSGNGVGDGSGGGVGSGDGDGVGSGKGDTVGGAAGGGRSSVPDVKDKLRVKDQAEQRKSDARTNVHSVLMGDPTDVASRALSDAAPEAGGGGGGGSDGDRVTEVEPAEDPLASFPSVPAPADTADPWLLLLILIVGLAALGTGASKGVLSGRRKEDGYEE
jgi:hypothetical protein